MKIKQDVTILGTRYRLYIRDVSRDKYLQDCDGYCDKTTKEIVVRSDDGTSELGNYSAYQKKVMRHEVIHAFLFESGLHENFDHKVGHDETFVDWFAVQFPKIKAVFEYLGCEE